VRLEPAVIFCSCETGIGGEIVGDFIDNKVGHAASIF
jgi:hypothetical protein